MKRSTIGWTDFSGGDLNFVTGCTPVSEGCQHCYARRIYERFGKDFNAVTVHQDKLDRLLVKDFPQDNNKRGPHTKPMAFLCDTGDLFHESVPDVFIDKAFTIMMQRQDVVWQILTKRADRMRDTFLRYQQMNEPYAKANGWPYPIRHIWLGVTAENQKRADERIPLLLQTSASVRFVSFEPLLGAIDHVSLEGISWAIVGGESGPDARPMHLDWARSLRDQCKAAGIAYFFKQQNGPRPGMNPVLDGETWHQWPKVTP